VSERLHPTAAAGFAAGADAYERGRAGYPPEAIALLARELAIGPESTVVDLAAGTGKLTRQLLPLGARVTAIEPLAAMRERLARSVPGVAVLDGTAERTGLDDQSVDVVLVAQAFHWFDAPAAIAEIHRVARVGLGVLWNAWDESARWVARMQGLVHAHSGGAPRHDTSTWRDDLAASGLFTPLQERVIRHMVAGDSDALLTRVASTSYIAALSAGERALVLEGVAAILEDEHPAGPDGRLEMPYLTHVTWCRPLPARS
jgi:SAM-dependent methyltransferase